MEWVWGVLLIIAILVPASGDGEGLPKVCIASNGAVELVVPVDPLKNDPLSSDAPPSD